MTREEAIAEATGIIRTIRIAWSDSDALDWKTKAGFRLVIPDCLVGEKVDASELDWRLDESGAAELLKASQTDAGAYAAALSLTLLHMRCGRKLPPSLMTFAERVLTGKARKPRRVSPRMHQRDIVITSAVDVLLKSGCSLSKNQTATHEDDACSIVARLIREHGEPEWRNTTAQAVKKVYEASRPSELPPNTYAVTS